MMLDFESAKRILATTKQHEGCNPFAQMYTEIFEELETTYTREIEELEEKIRNIESVNENELMELHGEIKGLTAENKHLREQVSTLSETLAQVCEQEHLREQVSTLSETLAQVCNQEKAKEEEKKEKPRRGRPPKKVKEDYESSNKELENLREDFGIHDLAVEIFSKEE